MPRIILALFAGLIGAICLKALAQSGPAASQPAPAQAPGAPAAPAKKSYYPASACRQCHSFGNPDPSAVEVCLRKEYPKWEKEDKHSDAYKVLLSERGKQMGKLLGWSTPVEKDKSCLSCHGPGNLDNSTQPQGAVSQDADKDGVSCAACHGRDQGWVREHGTVSTNLEAWRKLPWAERKKYGMINVWDPAEKAQLCTSCHVGDLKEGRVVTHEMYAAGHPPLPSIEIASFSNQMLPHWVPFNDKPAKNRELILKYKDTLAMDDPPASSLVAQSSVECLIASLRLLADAAERDSQQGGPDRGLSDFAYFDCYACHHDLKTPSWRKDAQLPQPGRPRMRAWPIVLPRIALDDAAQSAEREKLEAGWKNLSAAFGARPFGKSREIADAARRLAGDLERLARTPAPKEDETRSRALLLRLSSPEGGYTLDYDSARQIGWAFEAIYRDTKGHDPDIDRTLQQLSDYLKLRLPRKAESPETLTQGVIEKELSGSLARLNDYDPARFRAYQTELAQRLRAGRSALPAPPQCLASPIRSGSAFSSPLPAER